MLKHKANKSYAEIENFVNNQPTYNASQAFQQQKMNYQQQMNYNGYNYSQQNYQYQNYQQVPNQQPVQNQQNNYQFVQEYQSSSNVNVQKPVDREIPSFSNPTLNSGNQNVNNGQNNSNV